MTHPTRTWQDSFDELWKLYPITSFTLGEKTKTFISSLLSRQQSELKEKIEKLETFTAIDPISSSGANISITGAVRKSDVLKLLHT